MANRHRAKAASPDHLNHLASRKQLRSSRNKVLGTFSDVSRSADGVENIDFCTSRSSEFWAGMQSACSPTETSLMQSAIAGEKKSAASTCPNCMTVYLSYGELAEFDGPWQFLTVSVVCVGGSAGEGEAQERGSRCVISHGLRHLATSWSMLRPRVS